jgi:hypothetical protein
VSVEPSLLGAWVHKHVLLAVGDRPVELEVLNRKGENSYDGGIQVESRLPWRPPLTW